jgi:hypothetical protein
MTGCASPPPPAVNSRHVQSSVDRQREVAERRAARERAEREQQTISRQWFTSAWYEALLLDDGTTDPQTIARSAIVLTSRDRDLIDVNVPDLGWSDAKAVADGAKTRMIDAISALLVKNRRDVPTSGPEHGVHLASWNNLAWALALKELAHNGGQDAMELSLRVVDATSRRKDLHRSMTSEAWQQEMGYMPEENVQRALDDIQSRLVERLRKKILEEAAKHSTAGD